MPLKLVPFKINSSLWSNNSNHRYYQRTRYVGEEFILCRRQTNPLTLIPLEEILKAKEKKEAERCKSKQTETESEQSDQNQSLLLADPSVTGSWLQHTSGA
jgi:hypothetical protein